MNALNSLTTGVFDVVLAPLEWFGPLTALAVLSALFGILGLFIFKYISYQKGIAAAKDKIKGHMIEIRIYQDDLVVVGKAVLKVLGYNFIYISLNILPFIPLSIPFVLLLSQLVVRYAFEPLPAGESISLVVEFKDADRAKIKDLELVGPDWAVNSPRTALVRSAADGRAFLRLEDVPAGEWELEFRTGGGAVGTKSLFVNGERPQLLQPERVGDFWNAWLWPGEELFEASSPFQRIGIYGRTTYPDHALASFLPGGIGGILVGVLIFSFIAGIAVIKPLGVTI